MNHLFRLYYNFIPHFLIEIVKDHYEHVDRGNPRNTLLAKMALDPGFSKSTVPLSDKMNPNLYLKTKTFFPFNHMLLKPRPLEERERYRDGLFTTVGHFFHQHYRNHSLHWILPWRMRREDKFELEEEGHYKMRIQRYLRPLTVSVLEAFKKDNTLKLIELENELKQEISEDQARQETGMTDQELEELLKKPVTLEELAHVSEMLKHLTPGQPIQLLYLEQFTNENLKNPVSLTIIPVTSDLFAIQTFFEGGTVVNSIMSAEQMQTQLEGMLEASHLLIDEAELEGGRISFENQVLTYDPETEEFQGAAIDRGSGQTVDFSAKREDIEKQAKQYTDVKPAIEPVGETAFVGTPEDQSSFVSLPTSQVRSFDREEEKYVFERLGKEESVIRGATPKKDQDQKLLFSQATKPFQRILKTGEKVRTPQPAQQSAGYRLPVQSRITREEASRITKKAKIKTTQPTGQRLPHEASEQATTKPQIAPQDQSSGGAQSQSQTQGPQRSGILTAAKITSYMTAGSIVSVPLGTSAYMLFFS